MMRGARDAYRAELEKLAGQLQLRALVVICVGAPIVFVAVLKIQSTVPGDTLFGRWLHTSGFAVPLVVLSFAAAWGVPLIAGVVAGDSFASEDRLDTWKTVLTRSCTRGQLFAGKTLAAFSVSAALVILLGLVSTLAGAVAIGTQPLVDLSGAQLPPVQALGLVLATWVFALGPALGFAALGLVFSVTTRSTVAGVLGPIVVGLIMQLLSLVGRGEIVRALLIGNAFDGWHGLFTNRPFYGPLEQALAVSAAYIVFGVAGSWLLFRRRDFGGAGVTARRGGTMALRSAAAVAVVGLLGVASGRGPTGVTSLRLEKSITGTFTNLVVLQQGWLGRRVPPGATLKVLPVCARRGAATPTKGPGSDWHCTLDVVAPDMRQTGIGYDVSVKPNGCYTADGPVTMIGPASIRSPDGRTHVNPLFQFDGCFDTT
jgi:ABC-2 type transport system permease protein